MAAGAATDDRLFRPCISRIVAMMSGLAKTTGMRGRSGDRLCKRNEDPGKRKQQQKSGGHAVHAGSENRTELQMAQAGGPPAARNTHCF
jgi:hypothetical protein